MSDPTPAQTEAGKALAAARKIGTVICSECGTEFVGRLNTAGTYRYCSEACKQKGKYRRQRERQKAATP